MRKESAAGKQPSTAKPVNSESVQPLSAEAIVQAAIELIDTEGASKFSMRRLANQLGVGTMSVYWYFPSKEALFNSVVEAIVGRFQAPTSDRPWKDRVAELFRQLRAQSLQHPDIAALWSRDRQLPPAMLVSVTEVGLALMAEAGLDRYEAVQAYRSLLFHTLGIIQIQTNPWPRVANSSPLEQYASALAELDAEDVPHVRAGLEHLAVFDWDELFERGLDALINAVAPGDARR
jgi:AcrR family transcriptional regulator